MKWKYGKLGASSGRDITTDSAFGALNDPTSKDPKQKIVRATADTIPRAKARREH